MENIIELGINDRRRKMDNVIETFKQKLDDKMKLKDFKKDLNNINFLIDKYFNKTIILDKILKKMIKMQISEMLINEKILYGICINDEDLIISIKDINIIEINSINKYVKMKLSNIFYDKDFLYELGYLRLEPSLIQVSLDYIGHIKISLLFKFKEDMIPNTTLIRYCNELDKIIDENL